MQAQEKQLLQFLEWADKSFVIPVYQRNYDWKREQCKQLFDDIIQVIHDWFRTHFMGTIVAFQEDWYGKELLIIDWQQRLTTISLILLAIYKALDNWVIPATGILKEKIFEEFLVNKYSQDKTKKIRLKPVKDDREAFNAIFDNDPLENSNVTINFNYFYQRIITQEVSISDLYHAIEQLVIVDIRLKKWEDDPQLIFESLNSTWLDLTEADKVRNFILMKESSSIQEELYKNYWYKIEKNTNFQVSSFLRDYLTMKERRIPRIDKVYVIFKEFIHKKELSVHWLLEELLRYSGYYSSIINSSDTDKSISAVLKRINNLETIVAYPFLLEIYDFVAQGIITKLWLLEILDLIESYVFRRFVAEVPTNALNKAFMLFGKEIQSYDDYTRNFVEIFKHILITKTGSLRFPNDKEFWEALLKKDIYNTQNRNKLHLLERLENVDNRESSIEKLIDDGVLSIEHIMPQTLTPAWEKELWDNAKEIHTTYLHTLGNLTLTGYNSKYSNRPFSEKKNMEKGFNESRLYLNSFLSQIDSWNLVNILKRASLLKEKSIWIWTYPQSKYIPKKDETKIFTLSSDENFSWEALIEWSFEEKIYPVETWREFYEWLVKVLYEKDPLLLKTLTLDQHLSSKFVENDIESAYSTKIWDWIFLKVWVNNVSKISALRYLLEKFDIDLDSVSFYIK